MLCDRPLVHFGALVSQRKDRQAGPEPQLHHAAALSHRLARLLEVEGGKIYAEVDAKECARCERTALFRGELPNAADQPLALRAGHAAYETPFVLQVGEEDEQPAAEVDTKQQHNSEHQPVQHFDLQRQLSDGKRCTNSNR